MKATGIVRRIDDLGRVVIPKEIRKTLRIREGDPLLPIQSYRQQTIPSLFVRFSPLPVPCSPFPAHWIPHKRRVYQHFGTGRGENRTNKEGIVCWRYDWIGRENRKIVTSI